MADENTNYPEEKRSLKENAADFDDSMTDPQLDDSKVKFLNGKRALDEDDCVIEVSGSQGSDVSFTGLGKEELLKYADDPFWVWCRKILVAVFTVGWFAMLIAAIIIIVMAPRCPERPDLKWYQTDAVYQINPKSFKDSNTEASQDGAGTGDIYGVSQKLDYFQYIGVNTLWLNAFYKSGGLYDGNDVEDHTKVDELFGSMDSFKLLKKDTKKKGMRIVVDFIPNHTGKKHEWFIKSQAKDAEYADFYIWADGLKSTPPNNWVTANGQQAWAYDETRKQWYYFSYLPEYPDLNLRNEEVLMKLDGILRFWYDLGVDGVAVQGVQRLVEKNETSVDEAAPGEATVDQPDNLLLVSRWRNIANSYSDKPGRERALFGQVKKSGNNTRDYYTAGLHVVISDALVAMDTDACDADCMKANIEEATEDNNWRGWMLNNENTPRFSSVVKAPLQRAFQALHMLLPGTAFLYYGDEIGMANGVVTGPQSKDPRVTHGLPSRDPYRTPMLWTSGEKAGFCPKDVEPWLPINADYRKTSLAFNQAHGIDGYNTLDSFLDLLKLRTSESFQWGVTEYGVEFGELVYFTRKAEGFPSFLVVINRGVRAAAFAGMAETMELVYSDDGAKVGKVYETKNIPVGFTKEGEVRVFKY